MDERELENRFTYHKPFEEDIEVYASIRSFANEFASLINNSVPDSREKSLAITKLEEVVMWANAGKARN